MLFRKLFWNLFVTNLVLVGVVLLSLTWYGNRGLRSLYLDQIQNHLSQVAGIWQSTAEHLLTEGTPRERQESCRQLHVATGSRVTLIAADGTVLADTNEDPEAMDNHASRPEVIQAREQGSGTAIRYSHTVRRNLIYHAVRLNRAGDVLGYLRLAYPLSAVDNTLRAIRLHTIGTAVLIFLAATVATAFLARQVTIPLQHITEATETIANGDFDRRVPYSAIEEVHRLADAFNRMVVRLQLAMQHNAWQAAQTAAVFENMAEGILAVDHDQRVLNMNAAARNLLNIPPTASVGKLIGELVRHADILEVTRETLTERKPVRKESSLKGADGTDLRVEIRSNPLPPTPPQLGGAVLVIHDITRLWQLERIRRDFVANVSHELKTPITSIKGAAETLLDAAADDAEARSRFLDIIRRHADRLNAIITDLLTLSQMEQVGETRSIARQPTSISRLLAEATQVCEHRAREKNVHIETSCPADLSAATAPELLEQAIINLLDNAIKYSDCGQSVRLTARADGDYVEIGVEDHGCGIPPEHQPRIFERFYRVDKARSRALGGTGLGLAIVKHVVQLHQGTVEVKSEVGRGSLFTIRIPRGDLAPS